MSDLTLATRELFIRPLVNQVHMRTPVVEELQRRNQVTYRGGLYIERLVTKAKMDGIVQEYAGSTEALTDQNALQTSLYLEVGTDASSVRS